MGNKLSRLVYYSRNRIATDSVPEIDAILASSRRNNGGAGVTGALLFNMGCFGQILEGPRCAVEATFERIQRDERHGDVSLLDFQPIDTRAFGHWSMAYVGGHKLDEVRFAGIAVRSGFDPACMSADSLFEILHSLALEEEHAS